MIASKYSDLLTKKLLEARYIRFGKSPTAAQFDAIRNEISNIDLTKSQIKLEPEYRDKSSASKFNRALESFITEVEVIKYTTNSLRNYNKRITDLAINYLTMISRDALNGVLKVCTTELAKISGLIYGQWDAFTDCIKIDQQKTTANIDISSRSISLKRRPISQRVDLQYLTNDNFRAIATGEYIGLNLAAGSEFKFAIADDENVWRHNLLASTPGSKTLALEIDLLKDVNFTHIILGPLEADREDGVRVRVLGSTDGTSWLEGAPSALYRALKADIKLTNLTARFIRIEMTKIKPSYTTTNGNEVIYNYEFGLSSLQLFVSTYYHNAIFESQPIYFKNYNNTTVPVNKIRIDVSDQKPIGTDILYYLGTPGNSATSITPGEVFTLNNLAYMDYRSAKAIKRLDNFHAIIDAELETTLQVESIKFYRNIYQENKIINGVQAGWSYKDGIYSCIFEIENNLEIDLGLNAALINGRRKVGVNILEPGIYTFETLENNWKYKQGSIDPLYPYNHKLIIENGASFIAAKELKLIALYNLLNDIQNNDDRFFALRSNYLVIKIPLAPYSTENIEGWRQELHTVRYNHSTASSTTGIKLIARLTSNSDYRTPVFKGYTIVAGY